VSQVRLAPAVPIRFVRLMIAVVVATVVLAVGFAATALRTVVFRAPVFVPDAWDPLLAAVPFPVD